MFKTPYLLVAGCSHTAGVGVTLDNCWAQHVATHCNLQLVNLARPAACAKFVSDSVIDWLSTAPVLPQLIVVQWPTPYRSMDKLHETVHFCNVNFEFDRDNRPSQIFFEKLKKDFMTRLKNDPDSFVEEWYTSIKNLNFYTQIKIINVYLDSNDLPTTHKIQNLKDQGIVLHTDEKTAEKTWYFDSKASDGVHHSEHCHRQWANRIISLI